MKRLLFILICTYTAMCTAMADDATTWGYDTQKPLLTSATQLSSNACSKSCASSEANLIDGDEDTYYHSSWDTGNGSPLPNAKHYLQWHLGEAQQHIFFTYVGMNWASAHNSPQDVTILATNTPNNRRSWKEIVHIENMNASPANYPHRYASPHIDCLEAYTDFRMVVNGTTTGNKESTYGQYFFCLAEFQVYAGIEGKSMEEEDDGVWGYHPNTPLLTSATQLSSNACSKSCASSEAHLIDGNEDTYYHSSWDTGNGSPLPNAKHYLQWHLGEGKQHIIFTFVGMNWDSAHNSPHDVTILATNTPTDEASWVEVKSLHSMVDNPDFYPARYTSPHIDCKAAYTDFRMVVNSTTTRSKENTYGQYFFCLAEFQVYEAIEGLEMSDPEGTGNGLNIVFIGNSITYGATLASPSTEAPPIRVREQLLAALDRPVVVNNCGVSGSTTLDWLPGTTYYNRAYGCAGEAVRRGGRLVFSIMLGTNDSAQQGPNGSPVSTKNYKANMKSIIDNLAAAYPKAAFLLNYPIWYSPTTQNGAVYLQVGLNRLKSYHPIIDEIVSEYQAEGKAVFAGNKEAYTFFEKNLELFTTEYGAKGAFYLHPNAQGAIKLAEFWAGSIQEVVSTIESAETTSIHSIINWEGANSNDATSRHTGGRNAVDCHNVLGQPVATNYKGIVIKSGKKALLK